VVVSAVVSARRWRLPNTTKITDERHSRGSELETDVIVTHSVHCLVKRFDVKETACGKSGWDNSSIPDR
jgi:hypothetical protein